MPLLDPRGALGGPALERTNDSASVEAAFKKHANNRHASGIHPGQIVELPGMKALTTVTLDDNQLSDLSLPPELRSLTSLSVSQNALAGIATLGEMPKLTSFNAARNRLRSLDGIGKLPALERRASRRTRWAR